MNILRLRHRSDLPESNRSSEGIYADAGGTLKHLDSEGNVTDLEGGGGSSWDEATLGTAEGDWTSDGAGTWTFVDGVISQTDDTAESCLNYTAEAFPSAEYVVEAEIRIPSGQDAGTTATAGVSAGTPSAASLLNTGLSANQGYGGSLIAAGTGDDQDIEVWDLLDGSNNSGPFSTDIVQDEWHTLRAVSNGVALSVYLDGEYVFTQQQATGGNNADQGPPVKSTDLVAISAAGLIDFRNVKVWTQPLPA